MTTTKQLTNVATIATAFALMSLQLPALAAAAADQCTLVDELVGSTVLKSPLRLAYSPDASEIFVTDYGNKRALVLDAATGNTIKEFPGSIGAVDVPLPGVYDMSFNADRKVKRHRLSTGVTTEVGSGAIGCKDGTFAEVQFEVWGGPAGLSSNPDATVTAVADMGCHSVRFIDWTTQTVTASIGPMKKGSHDGVVDGQGSDVRFYHISDLDWSSDGTMIVVVDSNNNAVRLITYPEKVVSTLAGAGFNGYGTAPKGYAHVDGVGRAARFHNPMSAEFSPDSKYVIVADTNNFVFRKVEVATGAVSTITGYDNVFGAHSRPYGVSWHPTDPTKVIATDRTNNRILTFACAELVPPPPPPTGNPTPGPTGNPTPGPTPGPTQPPTETPSPGPTANPSPGPTPAPTSQVDALEGTMKMVLAELTEMKGNQAEIKALLNQRDQAPVCYGRRSQV